MTCIMQLPVHNLCFGWRHASLHLRESVGQNWAHVSFVLAEMRPSRPKVLLAKPLLLGLRKLSSKMTKLLLMLKPLERHPQKMSNHAMQIMWRHLKMRSPLVSWRRRRGRRNHRKGGVQRNDRCLIGRTEIVIEIVIEVGIWLICVIKW